MINFDAPLNITSIGQTSYNIFTALNKIEEVALFPWADNPMLNCFELTQADVKELESSLKLARSSFDRNNPSITIFHIKGSEKSLGKRRNLLTFHETDALTSYEVQVLNSHDRIFVTSRYTKSVFDQYVDPEKTVYVPLGFDTKSFYRIENEQESDVITFGLRGKIESRKNTVRIIRAWVKTFGGDPRYRLDCSIHNQFYSDAEQHALIVNALPDKKLPWNVNLLPFTESNKLYNKILNQADIDLTGMSGCEGFNLPLFQSLCLGKQAVVLNAHVHKDFCDANNSILVEPSGMMAAVDNKFFVEGHFVNQGQWFDFREKDLIEAMGKAAERGKARNTAGEQLAKLTFANTARIIKENLA